MSDNAKKTKPAANSDKSKGNNGNGWKKGQSGNPKGRPKDGESQASIMTKLLNMTPAEIADLVGKSNDLGRAYATMPKDIQMKYLIHARTMAALMFEPNASLLNILLDRTEGKVPDVNKMDGTLKVLVEYADSKSNPS